MCKKALRKEGMGVRNRAFNRRVMVRNIGFAMERKRREGHTAVKMRRKSNYTMS